MYRDEAANALSFSGAANAELAASSIEHVPRARDLASASLAILDRINNKRIARIDSARPPRGRAPEPAFGDA